jgi:hypothetical protein
VVVSSAFNPGTARSYLFQLRPRRGAADATMYTKRLRNRVSDADSAGANEDDEETDSSTSDGRVLSSPWHWCEAMHRAAHPSSRGGG